MILQAPYKTIVTKPAVSGFQTIGVVYPMKKRIITLFAFTSLLFGQSSGTGSTPPTPAQQAARMVGRLTTLLTLTTAQQTQATTIYTSEVTALATINTSMQAARTALQTAVKSNDQGGITTQAIQIGNLTTQQLEAQAKAEAAFYAILTADQQTQYSQLHSGGPGGFGGRGRGGFGGRQ
jgi:Spy/CpxP family protein refolding chaperone